MCKLLLKTLGGPTKVLGCTCNSKPMYSVSISGLDFAPAKLKRKAELYVKSSPQSTKIAKVEEYKEELVRCIGLDDEAHLYITDDYIVTHNSGNHEKMAVYLHPLHDSLESIVRTKYKESKLKGKEYEDFIQEKIEGLMTECNIQAITGLGLRGRTLLNQYVIIDEAQNPSAPSMQKTLTRLGKGCKVAIIGSNRQIDNPYITKHNNGLSCLINSTKTELNSSVKIYGVDLHKVVRSAIAEFAELLYSKEVK